MGKVAIPAEWGAVRKILMLLAVMTLLLLVFIKPNLPANLPPVKDGVLPPIKLPIPKDQAEKNYLGLFGDGFFRIPQIKAKIVIIEIFSLYCPACVKIAPGIKELYQSIEAHPDLKGKMKLIGIGAGNSPYEVQVFKNITGAPFPLFPDEDFTIHEALGDVRTPYFIAIKIDTHGTHKVVHSELGGFKKVQEFLEIILNVSGLTF